MTALTAHDGPSLESRLAQVADAFGGAERSPETEDIRIGMLAWSRSIRDHNEMPVGGLVVDLALTETGDQAVITIEARPGDKGPQPWRTRKLPLSDLILPLDPQTTNQLISWTRHIAGWIKARRGASDIGLDQELHGYLANLYEVING